MTHAYGQVRFKDGMIMHYEYNGTCDVVCNYLRDTKEDVSKHWRDGQWNKCICNGDEPVEIATSYGNGFWWKGRACKKCKAITLGFGSGVESYNDNYEEFKGLPNWWL